VADRSFDVVLVGGGLGSVSCARALRSGGFSGSVLLVSREVDPPYDRPPCSKEYLRGDVDRAGTYLEPVEWYAGSDVELLTRVSAMKLDLSERSVSLSNKSSVGFGSLLLATGAGVRRLSVPGAELEGIHYLRTLGNSDAIRSDCAGKRVVLIGGSYIGCEVAASLVSLGASCTIVMLEEVCLSRGFGVTAGMFFQRVLESHGVVVHGGHALERFEGVDGRVTSVVTSAGLSLPCDAVVVGAGAVPDVQLARSAGLALDEERGGVLCSSSLETSAPGVYAAGDIASYDSVVHGRRLRVEHWDVALSQGQTVAGNLMGRDLPHDAVPYFFSDIADWTSLEYVGPAASWTSEIVRGSVADGEFSMWYLDGSSVVAALSVGRSEDLMTARRLIASGAAVAADALADLSTDLETL
jgi:3-phenylpropionate/trans-cinnamate dioxygenase ferredoxin reductase subunit